ncbi:hypothetical protein S7S_06445 [Isoalcanivorax pacificus W11-5]|uniref:Lipoprotein n=1 Tax=Isoalcanivorax pacificus W11-5 TaxID=391936 RepID=A0A0B4XLZ7_9GAMM|nr:DUF6726 family protein [Isoalcanivorax pacificus]AJD47705.1 hypothetical protein S7S_06445 [Isoalcanivorax pacificus W11-5]
MKTLVRISLLAVLVGTLSGCFLTKLVTTPVRLVGSAGTVVGSALSILPVVGNPINDTFREANGAIDKVMDGVDDIPI